MQPQLSTLATDDCQKFSAVSKGNIQATDLVREQQELGAAKLPQKPVAQPIASPSTTPCEEQVSYACKAFVDLILYNSADLTTTLLWGSGSV